MYAKRHHHLFAALTAVVALLGTVQDSQAEEAFLEGFNGFTVVDLAVAPDGTSYVLGSKTTPGNANPRTLLRKYDADGNPVFWSLEQNDAEADTDDDGLPDWWEAEFGVDLDPEAVVGGITRLQQYLDAFEDGLLRVVRSTDAVLPAGMPTALAPKAIHAGSNGFLYIVAFDGTRDRLLRFDPQTGVADREGTSAVPQARFTDLVYNAAKNLVVACGRSGNNGHVETFRDDLRQVATTSRSNQVVKGIAVDGVGDIYVGWGNGLEKVSGETFASLKIFSTGSTISEIIFSNGWVYAIGTKGGGVEVVKIDSEFDPASASKIGVESAASILGYSLSIDGAGNLYVAGNHGPGSARIKEGVAFPDAFGTEVATISSAVPNAPFVAQFNGSLEFQWASTPATPLPDSFPGEFQIRWNSTLEKLFLGGNFSSVPGKPLLIGQGPSQSSLDGSGQVGFLTLLESTGTPTVRVNLTIESQFGESVTQVKPFGGREATGDGVAGPDGTGAGITRPVIKGSRIKASVPDVLYRDILGRDITDELGEDASKIEQRAETRILFTDITVNDEVQNSTAPLYDFEIQGDTQIVFKWQVEHALRIEADRANTASRSIGGSRLVEGLTSGAAGNPSPVVQKHWIPEDTEQTARINASVLDLESLPGLNVRYIVEGYEFYGAVNSVSQNLEADRAAYRLDLEDGSGNLPASPLHTSITTRGSRNFSPPYDPITDQQVEPFIMYGPGLIRYKWKLQFGVSVTTVPGDVQALPLVRMDGEPPAREGSLDPQADGRGSGVFWYDEGTALTIGSVKMRGTFSLNGWVNGDGTVFAPTGDLADLNTAFTAPDPDPSGTTDLAYQGKRIPELLNPVRVAWQYGSPVIQETVTIGNPVQTNVNLQIFQPPSAIVVDSEDEAPAGGGSSSGSDMAIWDPEGKRLWPLRPGKITVSWPVEGGLIENEITIEYGEIHYPHIAGTPGVQLDPDPDDELIFKELRHTTVGAQVDDENLFTVPDRDQNGNSVLLFGRIADGGRGVPKEFLEVKVVNTRRWNSTLPGGGEQDALIGEKITSPYDPGAGTGYDKAGLGTGLVFFENARYNPFVYDRTKFEGLLISEKDEIGPVIPVNLHPGASNEERIVVVWYEDPRFHDKLLWPYMAVVYDPLWPDAADGLQRIVISSRWGSESLSSSGVDQLVVPEDPVAGLPSENSYNPGRFEAVQIYQQPDRTLPGYNPNEEHAVVVPSLRYFDRSPRPPAAYALRTGDLNFSETTGADRASYTSDPYVLVQFFDRAENEFKMKVYEIEKGNSADFKVEMFAGEPVIPFYPLERVVGATVCPGTYGREDPALGRRVRWQDVKGTFWAVSGEDLTTNIPGHFDMFFYYPLLPDFWWPNEFSDSGTSFGERAIGDCVSFLPAPPARGTGLSGFKESMKYLETSRFVKTAGTLTKIEDTDLIDNRLPSEIPLAQNIRYETVWPMNLPILKVGETLTFAGGEHKQDMPFTDVLNSDGTIGSATTPGLPGIVAWSAGEVVFDALTPTMLPQAIDSLSATTVRMYSALEERTVNLPVGKFPQSLQPASGRTRLDGVQYIFDELPSSLQKRVFYDPLSGKLGIKGFLNDKEIGDSTLTASPPQVYILEPNIFTEQEKNLLRKLDDSDNWTAAVDNLYALSRDPNRILGDPTTGPYLIGVQPRVVTDSSDTPINLLSWAKILSKASASTVSEARIVTLFFGNLESQVDRGVTFPVVTEATMETVVSADAVKAAKRQLGLEDADVIEFRDGRLVQPNKAVPYQASGPGLALYANGAFLDPNNTTLPPVSYVTIAENNDPNLAGSPITLHVIKVDRKKRYRGAIKTVLSDNVFSENIILRHTGDFGAGAKDLVFEWWYREEDGTTAPPPDYIPPGTPNPWKLFPNSTPFNGATHPGQNFYQVELKGNPSAPAILLSDSLWYVRYRHLNEEPDNNITWDRAAGEIPFVWAGAGNSDPNNDFDGDQIPDFRPQLAQGWVKRVLDAVNPYEARIRDFTGDNPATYTSMLQALGPKFEGPVALNPDKNVIENFGLIELYGTILQRARDLSIDLSTPVSTRGITNALQLVSTRLADFYILFGNEAYTDALDPTIGFGSDSVEYGALAPTVFTFQNQLANPIDEELALLRGADDFFGKPVYNRLFWNFTKGEGEAAYAVSYNISDVNADGFINEADAMLLYPQGHGDAWGHYVRASTFTYELLRSKAFNWVSRSELYNLQDIVIPVDFLDERKFAKVAAAKAKAGAHIVDLTYRQSYLEDSTVQWQGYTDTNPDRAWGVEGWAHRAGQATYFDWVTANALLPSEHPNATLTGIQKVDRTTVKDIAEISANLNSIQQTFDNANNGVNPLGLAGNVVPFDIDPARTRPGSGFSATHFEQVYERAVKAVRNAMATFDNANQIHRMLRKLAVSEEQFRRSFYEEDLAYRNKMIELFGSPYAGTIGNGKAYPPGYLGPDTMLYMYIDVRRIDSSTVPRPTATYLGAAGDESNDDDGGSATTGSFLNAINGRIDVRDLAEVENINFLDVPNAFRAKFAEDFTGSKISDFSALERDVDYTNFMTPNTEPFRDNGNSSPPVPLQNMDLPITTAGYSFQAPPDWGQRASPGQLQVHLNKMLQQEANLASAIAKWDGLQGEMIRSIRLISAQVARDKTIQDALKVQITLSTVANAVVLGLTTGEAITQYLVDSIDDITDASGKFIPDQLPTAGFSFSPGDVLGTVDGATKVVAATTKGLARAFSLTLGTTRLVTEFANELANMIIALDIDRRGRDYDLQSSLAALENLSGDEGILRVEVFRQQESLRQLSDEYRSLLQKAARLIDEREAFNKRVAGIVQKNRYQDMTFRFSRNAALEKYKSAYDLAARYVYLAAKAYDYETALDSSDAGSAQPLLAKTVQQRGLGMMVGGEPQFGKGGLSDILAQLRGNYEVYKGQLGFNNPQTETGRFSLRHEKFRLREESDAAWRSVLWDHKVDDLWDLPEFRRYCRPFASEVDGSGVHVPQPAIVINFESMIRAGSNFFGEDLGVDDHAYGASNFATKIRSVGTWFESSQVTSLPETPRVYLIPTGTDMMTIPTSADLEVRAWQVFDQRIPVPFPVSSADLDNNSWKAIDSLDGLLGEQRRFSSFRAYHDSGIFTEDEVSFDSRLIGRSVWNTGWMLVIPGKLINSDADEGVRRFIEGELLTPGDDPATGARDGNGVTDIKLFFQTYGYSGG